MSTPLDAPTDNPADQLAKAVESHRRMTDAVREVGAQVQAERDEADRKEVPQP